MELTPGLLAQDKPAPASGITEEDVAAAGVPVSEHPALAWFSGDDVLVFSPPMGMAVDHGLRAMFGESGDDS